MNFFSLILSYKSYLIKYNISIGSKKCYSLFWHMISINKIRFSSIKKKQASLKSSTIIYQPLLTILNSFTNFYWTSLPTSIHPKRTFIIAKLNSFIFI